MSQIQQALVHLGASYRIYTPEQLTDLFSAASHPGYINEHRAVITIERIRFFAALFGLLMPLWLVVDFLVFPVELFLPIAIIRSFSTLIFVYLAWPGRIGNSLRSSHLMLALFMFNLPATFLTSVYFLVGTPLDKTGMLLVQIYALLPYMSVSGLGLFPLTIIETLFYATPLSMIAIGGWSFLLTAPLTQLVPSIWLLLIMIGIVVFAASIQLQYMISLVNRASYDPMTGAMSRRSGTETMVREFQAALMHNDNFAVALVDLDNAETIIAEHDYSAYDHAILEAAEILREDLRHNDLLVRWGEKVFLLILPSTDLKGLKITLDRIRNRGVGTLPDGSPVTASIGAAERVYDKAEDWHRLIELVDQRRNQAKMAGKDQTVLCIDQG